jgi:hypothetical protein
VSAIVQQWHAGTDGAITYRNGLLIVDEVGYIPFDQDAANLFFHLGPFARWAKYGDLTIASAMIDRIVHHADAMRVPFGPELLTATFRFD